MDAIRFSANASHVCTFASDGTLLDQQRLLPIPPDTRGADYGVGSWWVRRVYDDESERLELFRLR